MTCPIVDLSREVPKYFPFERFVQVIQQKTRWLTKQWSLLYVTYRLNLQKYPNLYFMNMERGNASLGEIHGSYKQLTKMRLIVLYSI